MHSSARWKTFLLWLALVASLLVLLPSLLPARSVAGLPGWMTAHRLVPGLDLTGGSRLVLEVSRTDIAAERPYEGYAHYSVSKAGLLMLTRALAVELGPRVRVNAVAPGTVAFPPDFDEAARAEILGRIPLRREGDPTDVARAVVFLAGQPYVTGQVINVDGGRSVVL